MAHGLELAIKEAHEWPPKFKENMKALVFENVYAKTFSFDTMCFKIFNQMSEI